MKKNKPEVKTVLSEENINLTAWLKRNRKEKGLTMRDMGGKLGVPHSFIGKVENQERRLDVIEYARYCEALGVNPMEGLNLVISTAA